MTTTDTDLPTPAPADQRRTASILAAAATVFRTLGWTAIVVYIGSALVDAAWTAMFGTGEPAASATVDVGWIVVSLVFTGEVLAYRARRLLRDTK